MTQTDLIRHFIDSANAAIYLKDDQGRFLMVNRRVAEMFKSSVEEIVGKTDYDFASKEDADQFRAYDRQVTERGTPMHFKGMFTLADKQYTVIDYKFPVTGIEGSPNAVGGIAIDITDGE